MSIPLTPWRAQGTGAEGGPDSATWLKNPDFTRDAKFLELATQDVGIAPAGVSNLHWKLPTSQGLVVKPPA